MPLINKNTVLEMCIAELIKLPSAYILDKDEIVFSVDDLLCEIQKVNSGRLWIAATVKAHVYYYDVSIFQLFYRNKYQNT